MEDFVGRYNAVRAIETFVDTLHLQALGFKNSSDGLAPCQPAFDPAALLKLYLYGYTKRVHRSRRQARECRRNPNLEVIWLLEGLTPNYRTIAGFWRINGKIATANGLTTTTRKEASTVSCSPTTRSSTRNVQRQYFFNLNSRQRLNRALTNRRRRP